MLETKIVAIKQKDIGDQKCQIYLSVFENCRSLSDRTLNNGHKWRNLSLSVQRGLKLKFMVLEVLLSLKGSFFSKVI